MNASVTHGADSTRLREIGDQLIAEGRRLREFEQQGSAQTAVLADAWSGQDSADFARDWDVARQRLEEAGALLQHSGAQARAQAADQDSASDGSDGSSPPVPGPKAPQRPPDVAANLQDRLEAMTPQERAAFLASDEFRDLATADPEGTKEALDQAFDDGLFEDDPQPYADYLEQYWIDQALREAGIDPAEWDPTQGFEGNEEIITKVYEYYGQLYLDNPDLSWAAMANMIGPSFAGGFADLGMMREIAQRVEQGAQVLPEPDRTLMRELASMSDEDLKFYETSLLSMQQEIFFDQGSMHQAYVDGGIEEIERMHAAGLVDDNALQAWEGIDSGDPDRVADGNHRLLWREQNQIIVDDYQNMYHHMPTGPAVTYGMTLIGAPTIPGARTFGEVFPVTVDVETAGPQNIPFTSRDNPLQGTVTVTTPLPNGNVADQSSRWALIEQDTWPAFTDLSEDEIRTIVESDFDTRLQEGRPSHNVDEIVLRLLRGFDVDARQ